MYNKLIIGLLIAFIVIICISIFHSLSDEFKEPHHVSDNFYNSYNNPTLITPLVGALGGQNDFDNITDPAHYQMKTQLMNQARRDILLDPDEVKKMHQEHMSKHTDHLLGPHNKNDKIWHDSSPYAGLAEIAEFKPSWSVGGTANMPGFARAEEFRNQKGNDFEESTMYEQDMTNFGREFNSTHALKTGTKPLDCMYNF